MCDQSTGKVVQEEYGLPQMMTAAELGTYLGVDIATLSRMRKNGTGPAWLKLGVGRGVRYDPKDVQEWLETLKVRGVPEYGLEDDPEEAEPQVTAPGM